MDPYRGPHVYFLSLKGWSGKSSADSPNRPCANCGGNRIFPGVWFHCKETHRGNCPVSPSRDLKWKQNTSNNLGLHDFMIGFAFCMFSTLLSCCSLPGFFFDYSTCWPEDQAPTLNDQPLICSSYSTCRHEYTIFPSSYTKSQGPPLLGKPHMSSAPEAGRRSWRTNRQQFPKAERWAFKRVEAQCYPCIQDLGNSTGCESSSYHKEALRRQGRAAPFTQRKTPHTPQKNHSLVSCNIPRWDIQCWRLGSSNTRLQPFNPK